jgi:ubiquinone biosynthesis accessory factor UbiJ
MPPTPAWLAAVEALLNRGIEGSTRATALARRLDGTALRVDVEGFAAVRASTAGGRLALIAADRSAEPHSAEPNDAIVAGSPFALFQLARSGAHRTAFAAQVRGDAETADLYRQLFALARPDPEEEMSRIIGDLPARRLSQLAKHTFGWLRKVRRTAGENIAEYLQEESRDLVNKPELDEFLQGVDALRETADRVEARLARLEHRLKGSS